MRVGEATGWDRVRPGDGDTHLPAAAAAAGTASARGATACATTGAAVRASGAAASAAASSSRSCSFSFRPERCTLLLLWLERHELSSMACGGRVPRDRVVCIAQLNLCVRTRLRCVSEIGPRAVV